MKFKLLVLLLTISSAAIAQRELEDDSWSIKNRGYIGFGLAGLNFSKDFFSIGVSGQVGYMLTKNLSAGVGSEYQYISYSNPTRKDNILAWYPFVRYNIQDFFIQADYDYYTLKDNLGYLNERRITTERFFIGAGYSPPMGGRGRTNILISYDVLYTNSGPFASPLSLRIYFTYP